MMQWNFKKLNFVYLFILLGLCGCGISWKKSVSRSSESNSLDTQQGSPQSDPPLKSLERALEARLFNQSLGSGIDVQITIHGSRLKEKASFLVRRSRDSSTQVLQYVNWENSEERYEFIDRNLRSGIQYTYALVSDAQQFVIHPALSVSVLAPLNLDLLPGQILSLSSIAYQYPDCFSMVGEVRKIKFGRLMLSEGSKLLGEGLNWWLKIDRLESQDGMIVSFEDGQTAGRGMNGRNSGKIFLDLEMAKGSLDFISRGENGGWGYNGIYGWDGRSGKAGAAAIQSMPSDESRMEWSIKNCYRMATWGPIGSAGRNGFDGGSGGRGGDSFSFSLRLNRARSSDLKVSFQSLGGVGGKAGIGGNGGKGGSRVLGKNPLKCPVPAIPKPKAAKAGRKGRDGRVGISGVGAAKLCSSNPAGLLHPECFDPSVGNNFGF